MLQCEKEYLPSYFGEGTDSFSSNQISLALALWSTGKYFDLRQKQSVSWRGCSYLYGCTSSSKWEPSVERQFSAITEDRSFSRV